MTAIKSSHPNKKEPLTEIFSQLGRTHAIPVVLALGEQAYNPSFQELRQKIGSNNGTNVTKSEISKCLTNLTTLGLVKKTDHVNSNSEAGYSLTNIGQEFYRHIIQMRYWAGKRINFTDFTISNKSAC
jgi:DNA-binding HxlR family transcriptional regulator